MIKVIQASGMNLVTAARIGLDGRRRVSYHIEAAFSWISSMVTP